MIKAVYERKRVLSFMLSRTKALKPSKLTQNEMCFCYVLVCAGIEFMIETTLREWIKHNRQKHSSTRYIGKKHVDLLLDITSSNAEATISSNHSIDYERICQLVLAVAGEAKRDEFKRLVLAMSPAGTNQVKVAIERVALTRNRIAHGVELPSGVSPNLSELENDLNFIYTGLIANLDKTLARA
jgi:hypothetical protein